jgi:pyruvate kinase
VAKLEKPSAIDRLEDVIAATDAVMVARGDLGVEMPAENVPPLQSASCVPAASWASRSSSPRRCSNR